MVDTNLIASQVYSYISIVGKFIDFDLNLIKKQDFEHQIKKFIELRYSLSTLEFQVLINVLEELPNLPEIIPIIPDSKQIDIFIKKAKLTHQSKIAWLRNRLDIPFPTDLLKSERERYPAIQSIANFQLAQKTFPWSVKLRSLFPSVEIFWVCCEFSTSLAQFRIIGLMDNPTIFSKTYALKFLAKFTDSLEEYKEVNGLYEWKKFVEQPLIKSSLTTERIENIIDLLFIEAHELYKVDIHKPKNGLHKQFVKTKDYDDYLDFYKEYWKLVRELNNKTKNSSRYQAEYLLPDGRIFKTGKRNKLPKDFALPNWQELWDSMDDL